MIRTLLLSLLWFATAAVWAETYHVDAIAGDDQQTGLNDRAGGISPWRSLARVHRAQLRKGDAVLFKRGGRWLGPLKLASGVTYGAYGSGALPVISGAVDIAAPVSWPAAGSVHTMPLSLGPQLPTQLFMEDTSGRVLKLTRARHPNVGPILGCSDRPGSRAQR